MLIRVKYFGLLNIYVFIKVMGEMFFGYYRENMFIVVICFVMIISIFLDLFFGWIEGVK